MAKAATKKPPHRSVGSLLKLLEQINDLAPNRKKQSDGWIGDAKHMSRHSDHNPEPDGTVDARDFTHDPPHLDIQKLADAIVASKDKRLSYIICNGKIVAGRKGPSPWKWRKYNGSNGHYHHIHVSVLDEGQDDKTPWKIESAFSKNAAADLTKKQVESVMHNGSKGEFVEQLQKDLNKLGFGPIKVDADFGNDTEQAVKDFQKSMNLKVDGWAGPNTLAAIGKELAKLKLKPQVKVAEAKVAVAEKVVTEAAAPGKTLSNTEWVAGISGLAGAISAIKEITDAVGEASNSFADLLSSVGPWAFAGLVVVGAAGYIIYDRRNKRLEARAVKEVL